MLFVAIQIALTAVLARCVYLRYFHPLSRYPGPVLASLTNLWRFFTFLSGQHHLIEQKLHQKHGYVVRTGPNSLSFSSLSAFEAIYGFNKSLEKGDFYDFARDSFTQTENVFSARTDAIHHEHRRKVAGPALSPGKVAGYRPVISKSVSNLASRLAEALRSSKDGSSVNIAPYIHQFTFDTIVEIIYGESICSQPYTDTAGARDILTGFRDLSKLVWGASLLPWLGWLMSTRPMVSLTRRPTYDAKGNMTSIAALVSQTQNLVLVHPERVLKSGQSSILKHYLEVPESDTKHMSPDQIWPECFNLTFAGPGSTAAALTSILYELASSYGAEWQDRIRTESSARAGDDASSQIPLSSPVLLAVIKETMRLHSPFPTAFPRSVAAGAEAVIPDLSAPLPVNTVVASNTYALGRSKEVWGLDADAWRPERWLGDESERKQLEDRFMVFSMGSRGCIGREVAMLILAEALVGVLSKWIITDKGPLRGSSFLEMQYEECVVSFTERRKSYTIS